MKDGNYTNGDPTVIRMVCTKCGYVTPLDIDIAYEVMETKQIKGKRILYGYCMKCENIMYPEKYIKELSNKK